MNMYKKMEYCGVTMKTRTNLYRQPIQTYTYIGLRCSYKAFKWSKHSQKHKLWVFFLQNIGRKCTTEYSHDRSSAFSHSEVIRNAHCKSQWMSAYVRLTCTNQGFFSGGVQAARKQYGRFFQSSFFLQFKGGGGGPMILLQRKLYFSKDPDRSDSLPPSDSAHV